MMKFRKLAVMATAVTMLTSGVAWAGEVVWWTPNFNESRARELITKFEQANQGIKIKLEVTTADGLPQRVLTSLQSGAAPDVIDVQHAWVNGYAQNGLVQPVDDVLKDRDDYIPASLDYSTWNGKLWAIPYRIETHAIIYNKGAFKDAGLDPAKPPQTWDELVAAAKTLSKGKVAGFAITGGGEVGNTIFRSLPFIWMNGGDFISADGKKAIVNEPAAVAAVKFYTDFFKNKQSPAVDAGKRRHREPPAVHCRNRGRLSVGSVRRGVDQEGKPEDRYRRDAHSASGRQADCSAARRLELRHSEGGQEPDRRKEIRFLPGRGAEPGGFDGYVPGPQVGHVAAAFQRSDPDSVQGHAALWPRRAEQQALGADHPGLFRRHPAHSSR
jgi:hypothetical protein